MKKLYIITELFPPDETSTAYILGEMANASTKEYEVHVICGPEVYDTRKKLDTEHPFAMNPAVTVHRAKGLGVDKNKAAGKALSFLMMSFRLRKLAKKYIKDGDKVLLVTNPAPLVLLMARLRKKRQFELNVLVHDVFPENTIPAGLHLPGWAYRFVKARFDKAYSRIDKFITLGRDMAEVVQKKAGKEAVVKEFSFLNTPKVYYSYPALKKELGTLYLENISDYQSEPVSYLDYIQDSDDDNQICSYSSEIFICSIDESSAFFEKIKKLSESESTFQIESQAYDIQQSYKTFIESFSTALFVFAIIAFLGVNFILGMISLSTFIENKKNSAILTCLGARNRSIQSIYLSENYIVVFVSIVISIFLAILLQFLLNNLISKNFALDNLIAIPFMSFYGYPFALPILLILIALVFSTIFTLIPMLIYRHMSIADELRDE